MGTTAFLTKLVGFVAWASILAWLAGRISVKLAVRGVACKGLRGEGGRGQRWLPWLAALVIATILGWIGWLLHDWLAPDPQPAGAWDAFIDAVDNDDAGAWDVVIAFVNMLASWLGLLIVCGAGPYAAVTCGYAQHQSVRRRQWLKGKQKDKQQEKELEADPHAHSPSTDPGRWDEMVAADPHAHPPSGRRIVICCDGTGNRSDRTEGGRPAATNVVKIFEALTKNEQQVVWYDPGVATDTSPSSRRVQRIGTIANIIVGLRLLPRLSWVAGVVVRLWEAATGSGVRENVIEAYTMLARSYRPGDQIYLIGFSRGAWTVRCLAAVIARCGVLKPSCIRYAEDVVHFFRIREEPNDNLCMRSDVTDMSARVAFLGVFDTVAALGVPLWGWWFRLPLMSPKMAWSMDPATVCDAIYHAVAMDERRSQYFVTLFDEKATSTWCEEVKKPATRIEQLWFRGDHSDIGGGRADTALSDLSLAWMIGNAKTCGLTFDQRTLPDLRPDPLGHIHDELETQRRWRLFGSWPRWFPAHRCGRDPANGHGTLHGSVHQRAFKMHKLGRPDLRFLTAPDLPTVDIEVPSNREWFRSGVVLEHDQTYRMTWLDGQWRDRNGELCGPSGAALGWWKRLIRWLLRRLKTPRLVRTGKGKPVVPSMTLIATHAHPQPWPPQEYGFWKLVYFLFRKDPAQLVKQLAPIGEDLSKEGSAVCLQIDKDTPDGMLWLFANDTWLAACDNSGAVRLKIERLGQRDESLPVRRLSGSPAVGEANKVIIHFKTGAAGTSGPPPALQANRGRPRNSETDRAGKCCGRVLRSCIGKRRPRVGVCGASGGHRGAGSTKSFGQPLRLQSVRFLTLPLSR